jgi:signal transduction histidine kinase
LHEINNPLNYMRMAVAICQRQSEAKTGKLAERLADIDAGIKRIEDIVTGLRAFAYPEEGEQHRAFSLRQALQLALRFTSFQLRDIDVQQPPEEEDWMVNGSLTHISQILVNLISNASYAIVAVQDERQGKLRITAEPVDGRLIVRVWDNGVGIDEEVQRKIFDPFYSTREVGEGTGLGLAICHTLARNHGGELRVASQLGQWTEFTFDLPLLGSAKGSAQTALVDSLPPASHQQLVKP